MNSYIKVLLLSGVSSLVWLYVAARYKKLKRRPNIQPPGPPDSPEGRHGLYVDLSKGRTFYRLYNEHCSPELPAIVLCHGFMGSSEYLIPLIESLVASNRRIYAIDLYGRGHSDFVDVDNTYSLFSEQISEFRDKLNIREPIDLIGYSMGGGVCVYYAQDNIQRLRTLTLIAPVGLKSMRTGPSRALQCILYTLKHISFVLYGGYLHESMVAAFLRPTDSIIRDGWTKTDTSRFQWYKHHMFRRFNNEKETLPKAVSSTILNLVFNGLTEAYSTLGKERSNSCCLPVLVMWGSNDRTVPCNVCELKELIPQARIITWPNEGHMLPIELAEELGEIIVEFWQQGILNS